MGSLVRAGDQIIPGSVKKNLMHITNPGESVIIQTVAGSRISFVSTGGDAGTGVVTIKNDLTPGFMAGFKLAYLTGNTLTLGIGAARNSTDAGNIILTSAQTLDITTSGYNGLDTGTPVALQRYYIFAIADSNGVNPPGGLISLSSTAPTMPSGYDLFRLVGDIVRIGGNFRAFWMTGDGRVKTVWWNTDATNLFLLTNGSATTYTSLNPILYCPLTLATEIYILGIFTNAAGAAGDLAQLRPNGSAQAAPQWGHGPGILLTNGQLFTVQMPLGTSGFIQYQVTNANDLLSLIVQGYKIEL